MKIDTKDMPSGYSMSAVMTLAAIYDSKKKQPRPTDIAAYCGISSAAVTGILDRLEKEGLVQRIMSADDRRSFQIYLTEKGTRFCKSIDARI